MGEYVHMSSRELGGQAGYLPRSGVTGSRELEGMLGTVLQEQLMLSAAEPSLYFLFEGIIHNT